MKKIALTVFSTALLATGLFAQVLFSFGKHTVSKDEFTRAFNKNPNVTGDRKTALREYLDLYINFKLKVQAAYDEGLDKDGTQQYELQNFRRQVSDNIINDQANVKELVKEAFDRSQKDIRLQQVFVAVPDIADTTAAYTQINAAYNALKNGKDFGETASQYSSDEGTKQSKGDLGYITVFTLPYEFENIAYSLQPGTFSAPVKTRMGYHIFKNAGERKPLGARQIAQILIAIPPNSSEDEKTASARKADSIYSLLQKGEKFEELATKLSNDLSSSNNNGELPEMTTGTYSANFENVVFGLQKTGDVSKPFQTSYGFHIIKLLEAKPVASNMDDASFAASLQDKVAKDNRMLASKKQLIQKKLALIKYNASPVNDKDLFVFTDSLLQNKNFTAHKGITKNTVVFSFAKQSIKAGDWVAYVKSMNSTSAVAGKRDYASLYKEYVNIAADEYYRNHLEDYVADFAKQVQEFKDANLLFGVMEKNVWGKANTDSAGLAEYYAVHKTKYTWAPSADAIIITSKGQTLTDDMQAKLKTNLTDWRVITVNNNNDVTADSGRYELSQLPVVDRTNFTPGLITAPVKNETDDTYTFCYIVNVYREQGQRSFEDARGIIISDYQQMLEDKWIASLKKKYPVKVNQAVFSTIK